jgi:hypothetical protein
MFYKYYRVVTTDIPLLYNLYFFTELYFNLDLVKYVVNNE